MKTLVWVIILVAAVLLIGAMFAHGQTNWTTRSYDNSRSGWIQSETQLTQASVAAKGISLRAILPLCCDARGMEAQPLVARDVAGHDIIYMATMSDDVIVVDYHTGKQLWTLKLGTPITSTRTVDMWQINQHMGCFSTGVIDLNTQRVYQTCWVSQDNSGNATTGVYKMFVIDLKTGKLAVPPVRIQGNDTSMWKQRASLVLTHTSNNGRAPVVFIAHGSIYETSAGYTGGITAFDATLNEVTAYLPMTAGIWMGGQGLLADDEGYIYAVTGNGDFDPASGFYGESFIKVRYTYGLGTGTKNKAKLEVIDQWSPWNDYQRNGKVAPAASAGFKLAGESQPSVAVTPVGGNMAMAVKNGTIAADVTPQGQIVTRVYPMATGAWADEDWGSAGPTCIFELTTCIAAGKDGIGYPINSYHLGQTTAATVGTTANYARLKSPCVWLTMSPGNVPCDPIDSTKLNFMPNGVTAHLHMTPVHLYDPILKSWVIFVWGENAALHKWKVDNNGRLTYIAEGHEYASADVRNRMPGGMPGGFCTASSNNRDPNSYLLACTIPYGDANKTVTGGRLLIYDPIHLDTDGSLKVLWDSQQWGIPFKFNKFMPPVIDDGMIIIPDYGGRVLEFMQ